MALLALNPQNFEAEVLNSEIPVLVDFWAEWCMPCRMLLPVVEKLSGEWSGKVKFCKLNTDDGRDLAIQYGIQAIPTILFFKNGTVVKSLSGPNEKMLVAALQEITA